MKKHEQLPASDMGELVIDGLFDQHVPFIVRGDMGVLEEVVRTIPGKPLGTAAVSHVEAPVSVPTAQPEYINLAELDSRTAARMSLSALKHDILSLGRTHLYRQFKDKRAEEQDLAAMVRLGIVESVHCRLHEKQLARARGLE